MNAALHNFPGRDEGRLDTSLGVRPKPSLKKFGPADAVRLLGVARKTWASTEVLVDLVDSDREAARDAGVETIAIELSSEKERLGDVLDALEEAARQGKSADISNEGLAVLRRAEKLGAEAMSSLQRFAPRSVLGLSGPSVPGFQVPGAGIMVAGLIIVAVVGLAWSCWGNGDPEGAARGRSS